MQDLIKVILLTYTQWIIIYLVDRGKMKNAIVISDKEIEDTGKLIGRRTVS